VGASESILERIGEAQRLLAELAAIGVTNEVLLLGPVNALMQAYRGGGGVAAVHPAGERNR
jgi:hypothetical protein